MADPGILVTFLAGLASFLSPCVLPLVPGYLSYMSGMGTAQEGGRRLPVWLVAVGFVAGFTAVFVALGATVTLLGSALVANKELLTRLGGAVIILMGLLFMGVVKVPFLGRETRWHPSPETGIGSSALLGAALAFGWSPCIGATMTAALAMAAGEGAEGGPARGALLLTSYSLGLGVPFVLAGVGVSRLTSTLARLRRHVRVINLVSGALLVAVGFLFVTDRMLDVAIWMQRTAAASNLDFWTF